MIDKIRIDAITGGEHGTAVHATSSGSAQIVEVISAGIVGKEQQYLILSLNESSFALDAAAVALLLDLVRSAADAGATGEVTRIGAREPAT